MRRSDAPLLLFLCSCAAGRAIPTADDQPHVEPELVGVWHEVRPGETLWRIARAYGADVQELAELNDLQRPEDLAAGARIFIAGAEKPLPVAGVASPGPPAPVVAPRSLAWPVDGVLYAPFGVRDGIKHDGIDIAAPEGTAVRAAAAGRVAFAGEQRGYGKLVLLEHPGGLITVYAHARELLVAEGARVESGQLIARVGKTGRATGPHLHFEVREGARPRNPTFFLP